MIRDFNIKHRRNTFNLKKKTVRLFKNMVFLLLRQIFNSYFVRNISNPKSVSFLIVQIQT